MSLLFITPLTLSAATAALVLIGLLLIYMLLRARISEVEDVLGDVRREIGRLRDDVTRREAAPPPAAAPIDPPEPPPAPEPPPPVDLSGVERQLEDLRLAVARLARPDGEAPAPETDVAAVIEARLHAEGYERVRVLLSAQEELEHGDLRVPVEGTRRGLTCKGYVVLHDGRVIDEKLTSSHEVFP